MSEDAVQGEEGYAKERGKEGEMSLEMNDDEFKGLRHRFWMLGDKRRLKILEHLGKLEAGEACLQGRQREHLHDLRAEERLEEVILEIEKAEAEIAAENEGADYIGGKLEFHKDPGPPPRGKMTIGTERREID